jgi:hypothetical protein
MRFRSLLALVTLFAMVSTTLMTGCDTPPPKSDDVQRQQQEKILGEATSAVGMPAIKNFRERRLMKMILELRDQEGLVTYTYLENLYPCTVKGHTALGGKLTYFGQTIGYGLPYATQFTNPEKKEEGYAQETPLPQADPNGLFSPQSAEGTWVMMLNPNGGGDVQPIYVEPRIVVSPFKLPFD